jgi:hypothetical protein
MAGNSPKKKSQPLTDSDLLRAHRDEHHPNHDQKWAALKASDAPLVRQALLRAKEIHAEGLDPAEAYLQGVADLNYFRERQQLLASVDQALNTNDVDPSA